MLEEMPAENEPEQLREMREAVFASGERLRGVMETAVNAIVIINERGMIETVNPATERILATRRRSLSCGMCPC